jgi:hypothetical protein
MAGYCKISSSQVSDVKAVIENCRRCRYYVPNALYACWDFKPTDGR